MKENYDKGACKKTSGNDPQLWGHVEHRESGDKSHCVKNVDHACQDFPGSRIKDQDEEKESRISVKESNSSDKSHRVLLFQGSKFLSMKSYLWKCVAITEPIGAAITTTGTHTVKNRHA